MTDSIRIFQLAKELNISHNDILDFLKSKDISVSSHMSPIDGKTQQLVSDQQHYVWSKLEIVNHILSKVYTMQFP